MKLGPRTTGVIVLSLLGSAGCVAEGRYEAAVAETETTRAELSRTAERLARTNAALAETNAQAQKRAQAISELERLLDERARISQTEVDKRDERVSELSRLVERMKASNAAAESRAATFRSIALKLKSQIDAGDLAVQIRDGRLVLQLPNDVLFDTGRTEIKPQGKATLKAVALALSTMPERHFQVAGHTDNVPIHNDRFASNWELSSGRALRVVRLLIDEKVKPESLSAAGYADVDPIAPNETLDGKKKNRRTEITVQPAINELVSVP